VTYTRLWELALGGGLAISAHWLLRTPRALAAGVAWVGLTAVVWAAFVIDDATPFPGTWALAPTLGTAAVIGFDVAAGRLGPTRLLGVGPMVWIGGMSYSLYLWHWPLLVAGAAALGHPLSAAQGVVVVLASGVVAWISLRLLENPLRFRPVYSQRPLRALQMGATATLVGVFSGVAVLGSMYPPDPPVTHSSVSMRGLLNDQGGSEEQGPPGAKVLGLHPKGSPAGRPVDTVKSIVPTPEQALHDQYGEDCISRDTATAAQPCSYGRINSKTTVALVGDSHAAQWVLPLEAVADKRGWRLEMFSMQNCLWAKGVVTRYRGRPYENCAKWGADVARRLAAKPPKMLIVSGVARSAYGSSDESAQEIVAGYRARWEPVAAAGAKVVVIEDTPRPGLDEPECISKHPETLTRCSFDRASHLSAESALATAARTELVTRDIDLSYAICPTRRCAPVIGGVLVYRDGNHLTATYAGTLAPRLDRLLPRL
jgi:hypothetical protein